jgi:hypothetical protein
MDDQGSGVVDLAMNDSRSRGVGRGAWLWLAPSALLLVWAVETLAEPSLVPPRPAPQEVFLAPADDQAGMSARAIARRFLSVPNMRAAAPNGTWSVDRDAAWSIRPERECLDALAQQGIDAVLLRHPLTTMPTPVVLTTQVGGVSFRNAHEGGPLLYACELAARLETIAEVVRRQGVHTVDMLCAFRLEPETSFHSVGLALDVVSFQTSRGELNVRDHFVETPGVETCSARRPADWRARALLDIACDLAATHRFSTVITPNYRRGHRDHFHIDARPDDPRLYVR